MIDDSVNRTFEIMKGYCILLLTRKACEYPRGFKICRTYRTTFYGFYKLNRWCEMWSGGM
jgi:hypothetical protein